MILKKVSKSICNGYVSILTSLQIQRTSLVKKLIDRLIKFLNDDRKFVMIIRGPSKCGKKYLIARIFDQISFYLNENKDYLIVENKNVVSLKNKINVNNSKIQLYLFQKIKLSRNFHSLFKCVEKMRKKSIFIINNKQYSILNRKKIKKTRLSVFSIDFLSHEEIKNYLQDVSMVKINESTCWHKDTLIENFYNLLKKPKYLKKIKQNSFHQLEKNKQLNQHLNVFYNQFIPLFSLNNFVYLYKSFAILIQTNLNVESTLISKLDNQFKQIVLNQFLNDLFNEKKLCDIKSRCFLIKINKYDTELCQFILSRIYSLNLKCIFIVNDKMIVEKYKNLFKFKFKINSLAKNDILVESNEQIDLPAIEFIERERITLDQIIVNRLIDHALIQGYIGQINRPNVLNINLEKENIFFNKKSIVHIFYKYLFKTNRLVVIVRNLKNLNHFLIIKHLIDHKIKFIVQVEQNFR